MKKLYVGNLPPEASERSVSELFAEFGTVRSIEVAKDLFSGKCRGFGFIEMEGHEARAAIAGLDGRTVDGSALRVRYEAGGAKRRGARR
ncbi:MAG: RNA-binding protein [Chromatiales bacterium]|nr:RNA-binding protein [Chromatiales bacterium]